MTLTLYANGHLVPCDASAVEYGKDGIGAVVFFNTTRNALQSGTGDPRIERVWGQKASGQMWFVRPPHPNPPNKWPRSGVVVIDDVIIPSDESEGVRFNCRATTPITNWTGEGNLAEAGDSITLPDEWLKERA
jgi:hypothetical protein